MNCKAIDVVNYETEFGISQLRNQLFGYLIIQLLFFRVNQYVKERLLFEP